MGLGVAIDVIGAPLEAISEYGWESVKFASYPSKENIPTLYTDGFVASVEQHRKRHIAAQIGLGIVFDPFLLGAAFKIPAKATGIALRSNVKAQLVDLVENNAADLSANQIDDVVDDIVEQIDAGNLTGRERDRYYQNNNPLGNLDDPDLAFGADELQPVGAGREPVGAAYRVPPEEAAGRYIQQEEASIIRGQQRIDEMKVLLEVAQFFGPNPEANPNPSIQASFANRQGEIRAAEEALQRASDELQLLRAEEAAAPSPAAAAPSPAAVPTPVAAADEVVAPRFVETSKPRYRDATPEFESPLDKALYIVAKTGKLSAKDEDFMEFAMDATGLSRAEVRAAGKEIRTAMKGMYDEGADTFTVPRQYDAPRVGREVVEETPAPAPAPVSRPAPSAVAPEPPVQVAPEPVAAPTPEDVAPPVPEPTPSPAGADVPPNGPPTPPPGRMAGDEPPLQFNDDGSVDVLPPVSRERNIINLLPIRVGLSSTDKVRNLAAQLLGKIIRVPQIEEIAEGVANERKRVIQNIESLANGLGAKTRARFSRQRDGTILFAFDDQGRIPALVGVDPGIPGAPTLQDVAARLPNYADSLTPKQMEALRELQNDLRPWRQMLDELGFDISYRSDVMLGPYQEPGFYIPRGRTALEGADEPIKAGSRKPKGKADFEKGATFDSMAQGIEDGYEYAQVFEAVQGYAQQAGSRALDRHVANFMISVREEGVLVGITPKMRLLKQNPGLVAQKELLDKNLNRLKGLLGRLNRTTTKDHR
jgi:hypothetical protein